MPIIKSAIKRAKQATIRRERNVETKKDVKSAIKAFQAKPTAKTLAAAQSEIDTAVKKNVLNKIMALINPILSQTFIEFKGCLKKTC